MMRSRSSETSGEDSVRAGEHLLDWGRSGSIKTITATASARDCAVSCQTAPASIRSPYFSGFAR